MRIRASLRAFAALALSIGAASVARAQAPAAPDPAAAPASDDWKLSLIVPIWMSGIDTRVEAGGVEAEAEVSFADILSDLELGLMAAAEAQKGKLSLGTTLVWTRISDEKGVEIGPGVLPSPPDDVSVQMDTVLFEAMAGWQLLERPLTGRQGETRRLRFDLMGGVRYWFFGVEIDTTIVPPSPLPKIRNEFEGDERFADPFIGGRVRADLAERVALVFAGNYGGFHISSDSTWSWNTHLVWAFGEKWRALGGYRMTEVQREVVNLQMKGPYLGLVREF